MNLVWNTLHTTIHITAFVAMMMLLIEYVNVFSRGRLVSRALAAPKVAYLTAAALGMLPGCLGTFAVVSLYIHRQITLGALVTVMVATSGDEAFVMLSLFPQQALGLFALLGVVAVVSGWLTDTVATRLGHAPRPLACAFDTHPQHDARATDWRHIGDHWRHPSSVRVLLTVAIALVMVYMAAHKAGLLVPEEGAHSEPIHAADHAEPDHAHGGDAHADREQIPPHAAAPHHSPAPHDTATGHDHGHDHDEDWMFYTMFGLLAFGLFVVVTVSDHFLEDHLFAHVFRRHLARIFAWTLGTLALLTAAEHYWDIHAVISANPWWTLLAAAVVGLVPESGPHLVFVTLFAQGAIPWPVLVASSIVQDGHGALPLLAYSRRDFLLVKAINLGVGLALGGAWMLVAN